MHRSFWTGLLLAGAVALAAAPARAEGEADSGIASFQTFCEQWMSKLDDRKLFNLKRARPERAGDAVRLDYSEYSPAVSCEASRSKNGSVIGRLVYHELHMRKTGKTHEGALQNQPNVLSRTEVMEIFRFDGKRWKY